MSASPFLPTLPTLVLALAAGFLPPSTFAEACRPNIVLIMADDMGFSDIGAYGGEIETPTLDALAAGGTKFSNFYNSGRCCQTRASLMTGLHPQRLPEATQTPQSTKDPGRPTGEKRIDLHVSYHTRCRPPQSGIAFNIATVASSPNP